MPQVLDTHDDLICYMVASIHDLPWPALLELLDDTWRADYPNQLRITFDEVFLRRLMPDHPVWVACLIRNEAGQLLGFELALQRTLYWHGQPFTGYYTRLLTIHPHYRRRGYGQWLLHCINRLLFHELDADLVFAAFHAGHAGLPAVQKTYAARPDLQLQCFFTAPVWGCRLDRAPLPPLEPTLLATRLITQPDAFTWLGGLSATTATRSPLSSPETFSEALRRQHDVAFGVGRSFCTQYMWPETPEAGTYTYSFGQAAVCTISYDIVTLLNDEQFVGRLGRIQTVYTHQCHMDHVSQALNHMCHIFKQHGCILAGLFDLGGLPHQILHTLAFRPTGDASIVSVRGPRTVIEALAPVHPPFFVDI
jgi:GNAT superfamily N-acetyltransferase